MVRSAQTENPGCFELIDLDGEHETSAAVLREAVAVNEPQLAVRGGRLCSPALVRVAEERRASSAEGQRRRALGSIPRARC